MKNVWSIDTENRETLIRMLAEAKGLGASPGRIMDIEKNSSVTEKDYECMRRINDGEKREDVVKSVFNN